MTVLVRLFGEVEVNVDAHRLDVGHLRQQCALVGLLVDAGHAVPLDRLQERVWGDRAPPRARATLYGYLSRLRHALVGARDVAIVRRPGGYVVAVDPLAVDVHRFEHLLNPGPRRRRRGGRGPVRAGARAVAGRTVRPAGHGLAELGARPAGARAVGGRTGSQRHLPSPRPARRTDPALEEAAASAPLDERLAGQLIVALYRCGRQADALHHFHRVRTSLVEELGADPGPALSRLHHQVLTADPALDPRPAAGAGVAAGGRCRGRGRRKLSGPAGTAPATGPAGGIRGPGGGTGRARPGRDPAVGHRGPGRHGQDVARAAVGARQPPPVSRRSALPVPAWVRSGGRADARTRRAADPAGRARRAGRRGAHRRRGDEGRYRSLVAGKRLLVVLDDALDSDQVVPLLPGTESCTVLVTSRQPLPSLVAGHGVGHWPCPPSPTPRRAACSWTGSAPNGWTPNRPRSRPSCSAVAAGRWRSARWPHGRYCSRLGSWPTRAGRLHVHCGR